MILHNALLLQKVIKITRDIFTGVPLLHFDYNMHASTIAGQAMKNNWPDYIIAACWLSGIKFLDYEDGLTLIEQVEEFSPETAKVLKKLIKNPDETEDKYYKRNSESPYARPVLWLSLLNQLTFESNYETAQNMLKWLPPLYPSDIINKYHSDMSR